MVWGGAEIDIIIPKRKMIDLVAWRIKYLDEAFNSRLFEERDIMGTNMIILSSRLNQRRSQLVEFRVKAVEKSRMVENRRTVKRRGLYIIEMSGARCYIGGRSGIGESVRGCQWEIYCW